MCLATSMKRVFHKLPLPILLVISGCGGGGSDTPGVATPTITLAINKTSQSLSLMNVNNLNIANYEARITGLTTATKNYDIAINSGNRNFTVVNNRCVTLSANNNCTFQIQYNGNATERSIITVTATDRNGGQSLNSTTNVYGIQDPFNANTVAYAGAQLAFLNNQANAWITDHLGNPALPIGNRFFSIGRTTSPAVNAWIDNRPLPSNGNQMFFSYNAPYIQPYDTEQKQLLTPLVVQKACDNKVIYFVAQPAESPTQPPVNVNIKYHSIYADGLSTGIAGYAVNFGGNIAYSVNGGAYQNTAININAHDGVWSPPAPHLNSISNLLTANQNSYIVAKFTNQIRAPYIVISVSSLLSSDYFLRLVNYLQGNINLQNISLEPTLNDRVFQESITQYRTQLVRYCQTTA